MLFQILKMYEYDEGNKEKIIQSLVRYVNYLNKGLKEAMEEFLDETVVAIREQRAKALAHHDELKKPISMVSPNMIEEKKQALAQAQVKELQTKHWINRLMKNDPTNTKAL